MTVEILKYLSERYAQQAEEGPEFDNYIAKRGISLESAKAFKLGITNSENYIINHINTLELEQRVEWVKSCVALGLINNHHGRLNDRFKYRIIFPIINREQTIVGFSTRTYIDSNQPRWINSRIIVRSEKNHNLIGEHLIDSKLDTLLIVEGVIDTIKASVSKKFNCVGTIGGIPSEYCLKKACEGIKSVVICMDNDEAGEMFDKRMRKVLSTIGVGSKSFNLLDCKDIDEYITKYGIREVEKQICS